MTVVLTIACDGCESAATVEPDLGDVFGASLLVSGGQLVYETSWEPVPDGWWLAPSGAAFCPACGEEEE